MANMTLSIPKEHHDFIKKHPEICWSDCARKGIEEQILKIALQMKFEILIREKKS